jgi:hypothetical protein
VKVVLRPVLQLLQGYVRLFLLPHPLRVAFKIPLVRLVTGYGDPDDVRECPQELHVCVIELGAIFGVHLKTPKVRPSTMMGTLSSDTTPWSCSKPE